jgi:hypothetical protein
MMNSLKPPDDPPLQCYLLSFEGPDTYAHTGCLASRVTDLTHALVAAGFETHLWFVGDSILLPEEK